MKKILQLDGGGILGVVELAFLVELEKATGKRCYQLFDMISGNSTGSIIGASLSIGMFAVEILDMYVNNANKIFDKRSQILPWNWLRPKYDRSTVIKILKETYGIDYYMRQCMADLMITSIDRNTGKAVFFKSWKDEHKDKKLIDIVARSFAAANYFGYYKDSEGEWLDGGNGANNCTLTYALSEVFKSEHLRINTEDKNVVNILSLGCGNPSYDKKISGISYVDDILNTSVIARSQSTIDQVYLLNALAKNNNKLIFNRINPDIDYDIDDISKIEECIDLGRELFKTFDYRTLL